MRAVLRRLHSPDALDLETYVPSDPEHFSLLIQAMLSPEEGDGEESFDFVYCSPSWLQEEVRQSGPVWGRHYLVDTSFDLKRLRTRVEELCRQTVGSTWREVAELLARFGKWEFEDYEPNTRG